jgi:DNA-binding NtrC family response regulator
VVFIHKEPVTDYQRAVEAFKRQFLSETLRAYHGNRTRAAQAIGLQRTYLLRLIRDLRISVPAPARAFNRME